MKEIIPGLLPEETFLDPPDSGHRCRHHDGLCALMAASRRSRHRSMYLVNQTISTRLGISIGNWQALFDTVLLIFVIIFGGENCQARNPRKHVSRWDIPSTFSPGSGRKSFRQTSSPRWVCESPVLIPALILFILAASFYMDVDMGTAPSTQYPSLSPPTCRTFRSV